MKTAVRKRKIKQYAGDNIIESLRSIPTGIVKSGTDFAKDTVNLDQWKVFMGLEETPAKNRNGKFSGELKEGQELNLKDLQNENEKEDQQMARIEPGINYAKEIIHAGERLASLETREMETQLREIMAEIKKLADTSKELQMQFKEVAVEQHTTKPGAYHKNFFQWLLSIIRIARMKVEDSGAWLSAMQSKKKSRQYGAMAKKFNTSFTLSNERTTATQTG